ncbi:MAG: hypothetical protein SGPRY_000348 [Prymnesium sp.]
MQLPDHLKEVLIEECTLKESGKLPCKQDALASVEVLVEQCPARQMQCKTFESLGKPTVHADELRTDRTEVTADELLVSRSAA